MPRIISPARQHAIQFFDWLNDPTEEKLQTMVEYRDTLPDGIGKLYKTLPGPSISVSGVYFLYCRSKHYVDKPLRPLSEQKTRESIQKYLTGENPEGIPPTQNLETKCLIPKNLDTIIETLETGHSIYLMMEKHNTDIKSEYLEKGMDVQDLIVVSSRDIIEECYELNEPEIVEFHFRNFKTKGSFDMALFGLVFTPQGGDHVPSL
jgi:hypothetical protein